MLLAGIELMIFWFWFCLVDVVSNFTHCADHDRGDTTTAG